MIKDIWHSGLVAPCLLLPALTTTCLTTFPCPALASPHNGSTLIVFVFVCLCLCLFYPSLLITVALSIIVIVIASVSVFFCLCVCFCVYLCFCLCPLFAQQPFLTLPALFITVALSLFYLSFVLTTFSSVEAFSEKNETIFSQQQMQGHSKRWNHSAWKSKPVECWCSF